MREPETELEKCEKQSILKLHVQYKRILKANFWPLNLYVYFKTVINFFILEHSPKLNTETNMSFFYTI